MAMTNYLTAEDTLNYGPELIDVSQRAALEAVGPHLQQLNQRLAVKSRRRLDAAVAAAVPNYQAIDRNPAWHRWLRGVDTLSGKIRQTLLNDAIASGSDQRIVAFFRSFEREHPTGAQTPAAFQRAETTRPTPFSRSQSSPSGKQVYTREMIGQLYERRRKGEFTDSAWPKIEQDIFNAQHESQSKACT